MARSIALVSHFYPPSGEVGTLRPVALHRHLRERGHQVTVITTRAYGELPDDAAQGIERTYDLQLLAAKLRGAAQADDGFASEVAPSKPHPLSRLLVPDAYLAAWMPHAMRRTRKLLHDRDFDCLITTGPPESSHLVGRALARRSGVAWLADLQDGWSFETPVKEWLWKLRVQHRCNESLERRTLHCADAVTTVSEPLSIDLHDRLGIDAATVTLGWEPADYAELDIDAARRHLDPDRFSLVYTGRIKAAARDPRPLAEAVGLLAAEQPEVAAKLELVLAGTFTAEEAEVLNFPAEPARIRMLGLLPRAEALALQKAADAALLITPPSVRYQIPAKTFEYFGAGVPILAMAEAGNAAAELVRATGAGLVVPLDDVRAIKEGLARAVTLGLSAIGPVAAASFTNGALIEGIEAAIERAIEHRSAGP